ncbi:MAG: hypothetical protein ACUVT7_03610 [Thermoplasmata archaeon]
MTEKKPRKYNDPNSLDELCRSFLACKDTDKGAAIEYCRSFLLLLNEKQARSGAVVSVRSRSR